MLGKITNAYNVLTSSKAFVTTSKVYSAYCLYHLAESATSHLLVLDTCRHGTNLKNWTMISLVGFDPDRGGDPKAGGEATMFEKQGEPSPYSANDAGYIYLARDSRTVTSHGRPARIEGAFSARFIPRHFAALSTANLMPKAFGTVGGVLVGFPLSLFSPTIKVHFRPDAEGDIYEADPSMSTIAIRTSRRLRWNYMGITGSLCQGVDKTLPKRIVSHPSRFLLGAVQGTLAVFVAAKMLGKPLSLPVPKQLHRLWEYRAFRWPIEYGIRFSAW